MARGQVALGARLLARRLRHEEDQLQVARGERRTDPAEETREERVFEQAAGRLGDDQADRLAAAGDEAPGGLVRDVAEALDRALDLALRLGADLGLPFTTRETVARDTPATRATSSRVAPRPLPDSIDIVPGPCLRRFLQT